MLIPPTHHQEDLRNINILHEPQEIRHVELPAQLHRVLPHLSQRLRFSSPFRTTLLPYCHHRYHVVGQHHEFCPNIHGLTGQPFFRQIAKEPLPPYCLTWRSWWNILPPRSSNMHTFFMNFQ
ncbi:hypothetical protein HN51_020062 [Arachis hypogaea]